MAGLHASLASPAAQASRAWPGWRPPGTGTMWHWAGPDRDDVALGRLRRRRIAAGGTAGADAAGRGACGAAAVRG